MQQMSAVTEAFRGDTLTTVSVSGILLGTARSVYLAGIMGLFLPLSPMASPSPLFMGGELALGLGRFLLQKQKFLDLQNWHTIGIFSPPTQLMYYK